MIQTGIQMHKIAIWIAITATTFALGWSVAWSADAITRCLIVALVAQLFAVLIQYVPTKYLDRHNKQKR